MFHITVLNIHILSNVVLGLEQELLLISTREVLLLFCAKQLARLSLKTFTKFTLLIWFKLVTNKQFIYIYIYLYSLLIKFDFKKLIHIFHKAF